MSATTAVNFASIVLKIRSFLSSRTTGTLVGIGTTLEAVDLDELLLLGLRGAGHAGELLVEAEVVLERDRRERLVLLLDLDALLRLDRLVEAFRPAAALHDPAGELVDDLDLAVLDHVVDVALVERLGLQRLDQVVDELDVARVVEVLDLERALDLLDPGLGRRDRLVLLVEEVVVLVLRAPRPRPSCPSTGCRGARGRCAPCRSRSWRPWSARPR